MDQLYFHFIMFMLKILSYISETGRCLGDGLGDGLGEGTGDGLLAVCCSSMNFSDDSVFMWANFDTREGARRPAIGFARPLLTWSCAALVLRASNAITNKTLYGRMHAEMM